MLRDQRFLLEKEKKKNLVHLSSLRNGKIVFDER